MSVQQPPVKKRGPMPPAYLLAAIVAMLALHLTLPGMNVVPFPWNFLGIVPFVIGLALNLTADLAFKKHGTTVKLFEESSALVTGGVFRVSRNPMYLGFVLVLLGIGVFMGSLVPLGVVPVFAVVMQCVFITAEEKMLEETFGERWLAYRSKVRRWM